MMWKEKRLYKRITSSLPINYEVLETEKKDINNTICKDICEGGLKLILKQFYPPKTKFLIKIDVNEINKIIETTAEIVWSSNMRFSNTYFNGMCFLDLSTIDRKILKEYISMKEITENKM